MAKQTNQDEQAETVVTAEPESQTPTQEENAEAHRRAKPKFRAPEVVEVLVDETWHRGSYKSYSDQYDIHTVAFGDGSVWQGGSDEIRLID